MYIWHGHQGVAQNKSKLNTGKLATDIAIVGRPPVLYR